jgi:phage tail sheath protein FI
MPLSLTTPGVWPEERFAPVAAGFATGVPAFLGYANAGPMATPFALTLWPQFEARFGPPLSDGYLASAVQGFFDNGGELCYAIRLDDGTSPVNALDALNAGLDALAVIDTIDLVCAPDIMRLSQDASAVQALQGAVITHCDATRDASIGTELGGRFAILDSRLGLGPSDVAGQRDVLGDTPNGALYYPWVKVQDGRFVPPCGHVAGVYARTDRDVGVHKAPANVALEGVLDLEVTVSDTEQGSLNPAGVNCLRVFPGRGVRVWGARTLSRDLGWTYVNVRRVFLTTGRWIERNLASVVFEPHDAALWARIERELRSYLDALFRAGALKGATAPEAFYVKCDAETNTSDVRDLGQVVTEIGLAAASPGEFVVVRIVQSDGGISIAGPAGP